MLISLFLCLNPLAPTPPETALTPWTARPFFMCSSIPCMGFTMIMLYVRDPYDVYITILHLDKCMLQ